MAKTLWGSGIAGNQAKPNWLTTAQKDRCYATPAGWVLHRTDGTYELIVAIRGLSLKMGIANIDKVFWTSSAAFTRSQSQSIKVRFDEQVVVTGSPTILINSSAGGTVTATYASISTDKTTLQFNFTTPAVATTLTVAAQSIVLNGGTIYEVQKPSSQRGTVNQLSNATTAPNLAITSTVLTAVGRKIDSLVLPSKIIP